MNGRIRGLATIAAGILSLALSIEASADMDVDKSVSHFGQRPAVWGMRLSPGGQKVSFLRVHPEGFAIAMVIDLRTGKGGMILASDVKKSMDLVSCSWANDTRLLCTYYGIQPHLSDYYTATRLVAVDMGGSNPQVLAQRQQRGEWALHQAEVIDLLPDINVPFNHGAAMKKALEKNDKQVSFVEYEDDDHQIRIQRNRIDMLQKIGDFLDEHLRAKAAPAS